MSKQNGWSKAFEKEWDRAVKYARRILEREYPDRHYLDDSLAHKYMALRNGYLAGHRAGRKCHSTKN